MQDEPAQGSRRDRPGRDFASRSRSTPHRSTSRADARSGADLCDLQDCRPALLEPGNAAIGTTWRRVLTACSSRGSVASRREVIARDCCSPECSRCRHGSRGSMGSADESRMWRIAAAAAAANISAVAFERAYPAARASASRGFPRREPRALTGSRAALMRSLMILRSRCKSRPQM